MICIAWFSLYLYWIQGIFKYLVEYLWSVWKILEYYFCPLLLWGSNYMQGRPFHYIPSLFSLYCLNLFSPRVVVCCPSTCPSQEGEVYSQLPGMLGLMTLRSKSFPGVERHWREPPPQMPCPHSGAACVTWLINVKV